VIAAVSFRRTLFLTRVPKRTGRFLIRRLASLIYYHLLQKKRCHTLSNLIKYIVKYNNVYNAKSMLPDLMKCTFILHIYRIANVDIFYIYLIKFYKIWLWIKATCFGREHWNFFIYFFIEKTGVGIMLFGQVVSIKHPHFGSNLPLGITLYFGDINLPHFSWKLPHKTLK
jgi:hypothetical protein